VHGYLAELTQDDLAACDGWMAEIQARAETGPHRARAALFKAGWERIKADPWLTSFLRVRPAARAFAANPAGAEHVARFDFTADPLLATHSRDHAARWTFWQRAPRGRHRFRWDPIEGCVAPGSLAAVLDAEDTGNAAIIKCDGLAVQPSHFYRVRGRVRTQGLNPDAAIVLTLHWASPGYRDRSAIRSERAPADATCAWRQVEGVGQVPDVEGLGMSIMFAITDGRQGTMWLDDVEVHVLDAEVQRSVVAGLQ